MASESAAAGAPPTDTSPPQSDADCRHDVVYNGLCAICGREVVSATAAGAGFPPSTTAPSAPTAAAAALYDAFHPSQPHDLPHIDDLAASTTHSSTSPSSPSSPASSSLLSATPSSPPSSSAASNASHRALVVGTRLLHLTTSAFQSQLEANMHRLFQSRKLMLVLDIDHTLLHTTDDPALSLIDPQLLPRSIHHFALPHPLSPLLPPHRHYLNLRPHLTHFLTSLAPLYDLHIYTMGSRPYAQHILPLIDPSGQLVKGRVVTRSESEGGVKVLERMCACDETMCVIVDDRVDVWSGDKRGSVVRALEYRYFAGREVYDREGKGGGGAAAGDEKRAGSRAAFYRKAAAAEEGKDMEAVAQHRSNRQETMELEEKTNDTEKGATPEATATSVTAETTAERDARQEEGGQQGVEGKEEQEEQEAHIEVEEMSEPSVSTEENRVISIPEEILIDEEKESPPSSPAITSAYRREVIAIDSDDSRDLIEDERMKDDDEVVEEVRAKKPRKRVRFHEPPVESIRHIESEVDDHEQKEERMETHTDELQDGVMGAERLESGSESGGRGDVQHWKRRMTAAMLDVIVRSGVYDVQAVRKYNEWCDRRDQPDDGNSTWQFNNYAYYRLFRCPLPACDRLMVHQLLPDRERFSCSQTNDHLDSAVTGVNGPCYVYMDMEGRVTYESVDAPKPASAADAVASDLAGRLKKKRSIPRKAVQYVTTNRPSILSQMLTSRPARGCEVNESIPPVVAPVLSSQMDESKVDNVLLSLLSVLRALHLLFYAHYAVALPSSASNASTASASSSDFSSLSLSSSAPVSPSADFSLPLPAEYTLPSLLSGMKASVLHGCHILFSGAFPSAQCAADTDIGKLALSFGAVVYDLMDASGRGLSTDGDHRITHIVAARDGSDKIKAGQRLKDHRPHVVHLSWLYASAAHFQRAHESFFPLSLATQADADEKAGVGGKENARGYVSPALVQHTRTLVTPLQLLRAMHEHRPSLAVATAIRAALDEEANNGWSRAAVEDIKTAEQQRCERQQR